MIRLLACAFLAIACSAAARADTPDPAVVHANETARGPEHYTEGYFGRGEARLHYVAVGKGPLLIFYHGFPSFWYSGFDLMEALKSRYRVVAVDAPGAGRSARPAGLAAYRVDRLAAQLDALARHLGGKQRFTLIGHDWGAALAFAFAQACPARLDAVIGLSAPPYNLFLDIVRDSAEQRARSQYMQVFRAPMPAGLPARLWRQAYAGLIADGTLSAVEVALFEGALTDPTAVDGGMNWYRANIPPFEKITAADHWPRNAAPISVPALLVWGDADRTFVDDVLTRMPDHAADLHIVRLPDVGHWATIERPQLASDAIVAFLRTVRASPRASAAVSACDIRR